MTLTQIKPAGLSKPVDLADNEKIRLGTGNDLQIYHDGSNSYLKDTGTGDLLVQGTQIKLQDASGNDYLRGFTGGAVYLHHAGNSKFETTSTGISVSGSVAADGLAVGDAELATFGNSADLVISHGGTDSTITNNTGQLKIAGDAIRITNAAVSETQALFTANGSVELYYDNDKVLNTIANGIAIDDATSIYENSAHNTAIIQHGDIHHSIILRGQTNADGSTITNSNTTTFREYGDFVFRTGPINAQERFIILQNGTSKFVKNNAGSTDENIAVFNPDGAVELYYDNSLKLETTSTGSKTTGMHLIRGESHIDNQGTPLLYLQSNANTNVKAVFLLEDDYTTGRAALAINVGESGVTNDRDLMLQKAGGKVGIRCTPTESFEVSGTAKFNGAIKLGDNNKLKLGTGEDLEIYHDGSNSAIYDTGTGRLKLYSNGAGIDLKKDDGESMIIANTDGAVELYYDSSKRLETTTVGVGIENNAGANTGISSILTLNGAPNNTNDGISLDFLRAGSNASKIVSKKVNANNTTDLIFYTRTGNSLVENARLLGGGGITFNGDTAAANALDDYEDGSWTPTVHQGGGTIGTIHRAKYTKIGRLVHIQAYMNYSAGSSGNAFQMGGLPFTVAASHYAPQIVDFQRIAHASTYSRTHSSNTFLEFLYPSESVNSDRITLKGNDIGTGYLILATTYMTS